MYTTILRFNDLIMCPIEFYPPWGVDLVTHYDFNLLTKKINYEK